jgi:Na+-translocating ferredoxin:NAD+ oxidoreductase RnfC subunit
VIDENLIRLRIFDCIDCNICTYVCTSKIPLAELIRQGKQQLEAEGLDPRPEQARNRVLKGLAVPAGAAAGAPSIPEEEGA